jgi:TonB-linked SusC/RagA family outer membrane protein
MKKVLLALSFLMVFGLGSLLAQAQTISGTVTGSEDGVPIPGVSVFVKGTTVGTVTQVDGTYTLNVPQNAEVIVFSFVGMETQEVPFEGQTTINVGMVDEAFQMDEVVVTALGIRKSEKALGYAATSVDAEEITKSKTSDMMSALSGRVAGVQIASTSSDPGASTGVMIRGISSLSNGGNQPLYVIDGVTINNSSTFSNDALNSGYDFGNGANMVNPNDIENITVLKGAAATALYGSRAANGVIMITTKSGQKQEGVGVTVESGIQVSDILRLPEFQNDYGMGWSGDHTFIENGSWGPRLDGSIRQWGRVYNNSQKIKPFLAQEDNVRDFFEYGFRYNNSVSFSGQTDKTNYYASFSQLSDDGLVPTDADTYDRYTYSLNVDQKLTDKLTVNSNLKYSHSRGQFSPTGQGLTMINSIYQTPRDISLISLADYETDPFDQLGYYFTPYGIANPYFIIDHVDNEFKSNKLFGKVQLDYQLTEGLRASYKLGLDLTNSETKLGFPQIAVDPGTPNAGQIDQDGSVTKSTSRRAELDHDVKLFYDKTFGDFGFNGIGGLNLNERTVSNVSAQVTGLDIPYYYDLSNSSGTPVADEYSSIRRLVGVYGSVEASYKSLLYATVTARNDWSSTLPKENNSFFYPGATLSFVFTELIPENSILSFGKMRFAYGKTGRDASPYQILPYFVQGEVYNEFQSINFPLSGYNAFEVGNGLGSLDLSPEMSTEAEVGMQLEFFGRRLGIDAAYYNKSSSKQIFTVDMDPATGYTNQTTNIGEIENKGIELLVRAVPVEIGDFSWEISVNYSKNENELVSLPEELGGDEGELDLYGFGSTSASTHLVAQVGKPIGLFKVTVPKRDEEGNVVVNATSGLPVAADPKVVGDANYDFMMGVTNNFSYKNLSLSINFDVRQGGLMYSRTKDILAFTGNSIQTVFNDRKPFLVPNSVNELADGSFQENTTPVNPADFYSYFGDGEDKLNENFLIERSFVKLRNVSLTYKLPKRWIGNGFLQDVTLTAFGNNLFIWTPQDNTFIDPEVSTFGNDLEGMFGEYSANPSTRKIGGSIQVKF